MIGLLLRANQAARSAFQQMESDGRFLNPLRYDQLQVADYDGMFLPGGHAKGMKLYLENKKLQEFVADFFDSVDGAGCHKPVAAICHGVVLAARSISHKTNRSVLFGKRTTALTWRLERSAWNLTRFLARFWDPDYYRTYPELPGQPAGYMSVEQEVQRALAKPSDFMDVPKNSEHHWLKTSGMVRDSLFNSSPAWVVRDRNYFSARWPGDVHTLSLMLVDALKDRADHG